MDKLQDQLQDLQDQLQDLQHHLVVQILVLKAMVLRVFDVILELVLEAVLLARRWSCSSWRSLY